MVSELRREREAGWILAFGVAVSAAPAFWYRRVWPDSSFFLGVDTSPARGFWWFVFAASLIPFVLTAILRDRGALSLIAACVSTLVAGVVVVLGQLAGLDPSDLSPSAGIACVFMPLVAAVVVVFIYLFDEAIRARLSQRREGDDSH